MVDNRETVMVALKKTNIFVKRPGCLIIKILVFFFTFLCDINNK